MFKSKKKEKKESSTSQSSTSSYNESTHVQVSNNGRLTSTTITRQTSTQSHQLRSTEERTLAVQHSSSAGNVPQLVSRFNSPLPSLQQDATPFRWRTGSTRAPASSNVASLPPTSLSTTFGTSSLSTQPRLSLPYRSPASSGNVPTYRSAYGTNTFGSYPSRTRPSPLAAISSQSAAQNPCIAQSLPASNEHIIPTYSNSCAKIGKALIINNIKFVDNKDERKGAEKDSEDLSKLLKKIGFEVESKKDMKGEAMLKKVGNFSKSSFFSHDMSVVVIMSHGNNIVQDGNKLSRVKGGYTEIAGIDNVPLLVDDIIEQFTVAKCHPSLKNKPKIFIFQCCRGDKDQEVAHDAVPMKKVLKEHSDILIAFSTLPGYLSNRNPTTGTWYIQSICEVFERHYKDFDIESMLKIVDDQLSKKHPKYTQTSTYENRGFKRCFLYRRNST